MDTLVPFFWPLPGLGLKFFVVLVSEILESQLLLPSNFRFFTITTDNPNTFKYDSGFQFCFDMLFNERVSPLYLDNGANSMFVYVFMAELQHLFCVHITLYCVAFNSQ